MNENQRVPYLRDLIINISTAMDEVGIKYWADWGTLLGLIRERDVISWDIDVDFGILTDDKHKLESLKENLKLRGFLWHSDQEGVLKISRCKPSPFPHRPRPCCDATGDIIQYSVLDNKIIPAHEKRGIAVQVWKNCHWGRAFWRRSVADLKFITQLNTIKYNGVKINIPNNVEKFLEIRYGKDWRVPINYYA